MMYLEKPKWINKDNLNNKYDNINIQARFKNSFVYEENQFG